MSRSCVVKEIASSDPERFGAVWGKDPSCVGMTISCPCVFFVVGNLYDQPRFGPVLNALVWPGGPDVLRVQSWIIWCCPESLTCCVRRTKVCWSPVAPVPAS